jgi:hypothetical protein
VREIALGLRAKGSDTALPGVIFLFPAPALPEATDHFETATTSSIITVVVSPVVPVAIMAAPMIVALSPHGVAFATAMNPRLSSLRAISPSRRVISGLLSDT